MTKKIMRKWHRRISRISAMATALLTSVLMVACGGESDNVQTSQWVASWYVAQQNYNEPLTPLNIPTPPPVTISNQTVRQIVHVSYGGTQARVKLSNLFNTTPVTFTAVRVARSTGGGGIDTGSDQLATFSGASTVTLAPGAEVWSDAVNISFPSESDLAISIFVQQPTQVVSSHTIASETNFLVSGNQASASTLTNSTTFNSYYWVEGIDVRTSDNVKVVVAFGDSITDGYASTVNLNHRWPNRLDDRLKATPEAKISIVNSGIGGNRWLHDQYGQNGVDRFSRDVLGVSGATDVFILLGINDIGLGNVYAPQYVKADQVIAAISNAAAKAKAQGLKVYLGTLTPYQGSAISNADGESERQAINAFIRSATNVDGIVDFDKALQDPSNPTKLLGLYDSGDHIHPNDAGYQAMGNAVNLSFAQ